MTNILLFAIITLLIIGITFLLVILRKSSKIDFSLIASRLDAFEKTQDDLPPKKWTQRRVGVSIAAGS